MPDYLDDPSTLTKDKLKSELLAHNVELPSGNPTKDVYVQLYLKNLTQQNHNQVPAATLDLFSSDEELPPPVVSSRSRSSGRKATRKTDKVRPDEMDVTTLSDDGLKSELLKHGVEAGPIVASTRKLYEKKLQRLLDDGPAQPKLVVTEIQVNHNGNSESDLYSDKEDDVVAAPEPEPAVEPEPEPEPAPVVERPVRSRGKTAVTTRTHSSSSQHQTREQLMDEEDDDDGEEEEVLQVKRKSRKLSRRMQIVPEVLRPVLTSQIQLESDKRVYHRRDSPARAEPPTIASRPAQLKVEDLRLSLPNPGKDSSPQPAALLDTALLEEPEPGIDPVRPAAPVEKIAASEQITNVEQSEVLKELFPNDINSPTGISATCRRPIRGAARRPVKYSDLWNDENRLFSPKTSKTTLSSSTTSTSYRESCTANRVASLPPSASPFSTAVSSSSSRLVSAAPPAGQPKAAYRSVSLWIKLFLLAVVAAFLFLVYQAMETNTINPFAASNTDVASGSTA